MGTLRRRLRRLSVGPRSEPPPLLLGLLGPIVRQGDWRSQLVREGDARPDLRSTNFSGCELRGIDFSLCRMDGASFDGADLTGASFSGTDLRNSSFVGATLDRAVFEAVNGVDARVDRARLEQAFIGASNFAHASFRHARLDGAQLLNTTLYGADLRNMSLCDARVVSVDFEDADVSWVTRGKPSTPVTHFAPLLRHYMSFLGLDPVDGLRAAEAGIEASGDVQADLRELIAMDPDWRVHVVCACVAGMAGVDDQSRAALWARVVEGSWASPQLVAALSLSEDFPLAASGLLHDVRLNQKARSSIAAVLCSLPALDARIRTAAEPLAIGEGRRAVRWLARLDELTQPVGSLR